MLETESRTSKPDTLTRSSLRIAIIGCGAITESYYLPALAGYPSLIKNLILVDRNKARAQQLSAEFNAGSCLTDHRDILTEDLDGVIIAAPSHLHYSISMDFLTRGVHVLCEKPLASSIADARQMVDQAAQTGAILSTNYMRRLYASYAKVKQLLTEGSLGQPLSIQYYEGEEFRWPTASGFYFNTKISSRGVLLDRGAHVLDLICWWLGEKPQVVLSQNDSFGGREAVAYVQFRARQCLGEVKLSLLGKFPCVFTVKCEHGTITGDVFDFQSVTLTTKSGQKRLKLKSNEKYHKDFGYTMVGNFLDVISKGSKPLVSGADVLDSVELIDECYETASRFDMSWYETVEIDNGR